MNLKFTLILQASLVGGKCHLVLMIKWKSLDDNTGTVVIFLIKLSRQTTWLHFFLKKGCLIAKYDFKLRHSKG